MRYVIALFAVLAAMPAAATELCEDLWFTRNQIMDRAGYCFGSTLGKAMFDNDGCTGKSVTLSAKAQQQVAEIRRLEGSLQCKVDTSRSALELVDLATRRQLIDLPIHDEFESGCIGWQEAPADLHAGHKSTSPVIGRIEPGDDVLYSHYTYPPVEGWAYVTIWSGGWGDFKSAGWLGVRTSENSCRQFAG
jgi:hypothetical protein